MSNAEEFDPFAPGSNLKEDFDGVVKEVRFEKSSQGDNYTAHVIVQADDGDEVESFLSLGKDWVTYDGGRSVEHPRGARMKFNGQTGYSEWITFAMGGFDGDRHDPDAEPADIQLGRGAAGVLRERNRRLDNRGPQMAELWEGLRFHFDVVNRHGRTRRGDQWVDVVNERMMPVRYLGEVAQQQSFPQPPQPQPQPQPQNVQSHPMPPGYQQQQPTLYSTSGGSIVTVQAAPQPTVPPAASPPSAPPAPVPAVHPALASLSALDQSRVRSLAQQQDFGGFVDGVMGLSKEGGGTMLEVPALIQALSDEQFYLSLRG
jgi:hypothetical protein